MFIVSLTYKTDISQVEKHLDAHISFLKKYYQQRAFIASGRKVPRTGGVILVNAESLDDVEKIISEDPFFVEDVADYQITEFIPTMAAPEFEGLKQL
ncbi:YciI family protein [Thalassotalea ganghwensis]